MSEEKKVTENASEETENEELIQSPSDNLHTQADSAGQDGAGITDDVSGDDTEDISVTASDGAGDDGDDELSDDQADDEADDQADAGADDASTKDKKKKSRKPITRKTRHYLVSVSLVVLITAAVVISNMIAGVLTEKFPVLRADLTGLQSFRITDTSVKLASEVGKGVEIDFLMSRSEYEATDPYCKQTALIADQLAESSDGMITVKFVDLVKYPTFESDFPEENLSTTDVIVRCGEKYKKLDRNDLFNFEYYSQTYQYITSSKAEQAIVNAVKMVISDVAAHVAIVTDNSGEDYSTFKSILQANNYDVAEISVEKEKIPDNVQMLILFSPSKDYSNEAMTKIREFIMNNGNYNHNVIYTSYRRDIDTPNIDLLLSEFGMKNGDGLAFEMDSDRLVSTSYYDGIAAYFASKLYIDGYTDEDRPVLTGFARPIAIIDDNAAEPLIRLSDSSGYCPYDADEDTWSMPEAITGSVFVAAQGTTGPSEKTQSVLVNFPSTMLMGEYLDSQFSNQKYVLSVMKSLNKVKDDEFILENKVITEYDINLTREENFRIGFIIFALIPMIILGIGLTVFLTRRSK